MERLQLWLLPKLPKLFKLLLGYEIPLLIGNFKTDWHH